MYSSSLYVVPRSNQLQVTSETVWLVPAVNATLLVPHTLVDSDLIFAGVAVAAFSAVMIAHHPKPLIVDCI